MATILGSRYVNVWSIRDGKMVWMPDVWIAPRETSRDRNKSAAGYLVAPSDLKEGVINRSSFKVTKEMIM